MTKVAVASIALVLALALALLLVPAGKENLMSSPFSEEIAAAYPDAPEGIRKVAAAIRAGEAPDPALLAELGAEALSQPYVGTNNQRSVLLNDTLLHENVAAAEALVAAGADVRYSDDLMAFNAVRMTEGRTVVPFANHSPGLPFLRLYLENGGDPDVQFFRDNIGQSLLAYNHDNLAGALLLLQNGADPWKKHLSPRGNPMKSYFEGRLGSSGNGIAAEFLFRIIIEGHFAGGPEPQLREIVSELEEALSNSIEDRASGRQQQAWRFQQLLTAAYATTGLSPSPEIAALLDREIDERFKGWHLRPDQFYSGDEFEGPVIPDVGPFFWTYDDRTVRVVTERPRP